MQYGYGICLPRNLRIHPLAFVKALPEQYAKYQSYLKEESETESEESCTDFLGH